MSQELTVSLQVVCGKNGMLINRSLSLTSNMTGNNMLDAIQQNAPSASWQVIASPTNTPQLMVVINTESDLVNHPNNFVRIALDSAGATVIAKIPPQGFFAWHPDSWPGFGFYMRSTDRDTPVETIIIDT